MGGSVVGADVDLSSLSSSPATSLCRYHMHDAMHWRALHRLDVEPDEWPSEVERYDLVCSLGQLGVTPEGGEGARLVAAAARTVDSRSACNDLQSQATGFEGGNNGAGFFVG